MTLDERVRHQIGEEGPQHDSDEAYERYIDEVLEGMTKAELLRRISDEITALGLRSHPDIAEPAVATAATTSSSAEETKATSETATDAPTMPTRRQLAYRFVQLRQSDKADIAKAMEIARPIDKGSMEADKAFLHAVWNEAREPELHQALVAREGPSHR